MCLAISQVDISVIEGMQIDYRLEGNSIILQLKAILDTGSEINIGSEKRMGKYIVECGRKTNILSVLNKKKFYGAREIDGWFDTSPAQILIAKEMC